ncbi:MAG: Gfo/Idh/MocA family oxidoreductase [Rhodocyclales bacterium]|nr:Gfo/Idh/MocA family oxidoreductase [Rhodocyclales bacterium]
MSKFLRAAVIGVGYLGRFHAQKYAALPDVELVGVVDPNPERAAAVAKELGTAAFASHAELGGKVDLVSIASTTESHYRIARDCLAAGLHVLVEKPITVTVAEADELIGLADAGKRMLQVGHLERYNPAWLAVRDRIGTPLFIEAHRMAPFKPRGTDVSVILDLMIHDLDLILPLVQSPIANLRASGVAVLTEGIDIANARIEFANGCVANITASRASTASLRRMRIFQHHEYLSVDFGERKIGFAKKRDALIEGESPIDSESRIEPPGDALLSEIQAFVASVRGEAVPGGLCTGRDGREALAVALEIERLMSKQGIQ